MVSLSGPNGDGTGDTFGVGSAGPAGDQPADAGTVELDEAALETARSAAAADAEGAAFVGAVVDVSAEDAVAVTVRFRALLPGYLGWVWSVTIALLDSSHPTVSEVVLLPGPDALLAPEWVPWSQRIRSGDLGVGDLLLTAPDDPRLVPAYLQSDDPAVEAVAQELGVGRVRVLSRDGRAEAAERWHDGSFGPGDEMALAAPAHCATCAFYLPLAGSLGAGFGACGNEYSPADGRVVDALYGCGAHSEAISSGRPRSATADTVIDELRLEVHRREPAAAVAGMAQDGDDGSAQGGDDGSAGSALAGRATPDPAGDSAAAPGDPLATG